MPTVKDKTTGKVISEQRYNQEGIQNAATIAESNPNWEVEYDVSDAQNRSEVTYMGGGYVPEYKKGGKVSKTGKFTPDYVGDTKSLERPKPYGPAKKLQKEHEEYMKKEHPYRYYTKLEKEKIKKEKKKSLGKKVSTIKWLRKNKIEQKYINTKKKQPYGRKKK